MIEFVCTAPTSIRIAIWVAMVILHFHMAQLSSFLEHFFLYSAGPREQFGINEKLSWGARWVKLDTGVQRRIEYIEIAFCILA